VWFHNAGAGAEAGFRFSERLGLGAEIGFGHLQESTSGWQEDSYESTAKTTYSAMPASLSLYYVTPVSDRLAIYVGLGGGYYALSIKNETEEYSPYYSQARTTTDTQKARAFAPQVCLGLNRPVQERRGRRRRKHRPAKHQCQRPIPWIYQQADIAFGDPGQSGDSIMLGGSRRP
jgi:opacity protein-like surface antigen